MVYCNRISDDNDVLFVLPLEVLLSNSHISVLNIRHIALEYVHSYPQSKHKDHSRTARVVRTLILLANYHGYTIIGKFLMDTVTKPFRLSLQIYEKTCPRKSISLQKPTLIFSMFFFYLRSSKEIVDIFFFLSFGLKFLVFLPKLVFFVFYIREYLVQIM